MQEKDFQFKELLSQAKKDPNIVGLFLGGSRAKGFHDEKSDYDIFIIVKNEVIDKYKEKYPKHKYNGIDLMIFSEDEFAEHALWKSDTQTNRYNFAYTKALIDKSGLIQKMLNDKGAIPPEEQAKYIGKHVNAYLNHLIRSVRCYERNDSIGFRLSIGYFVYHALCALLGLEGRISPYSDYFERELRIRPLKNISMNSNELLKIIDNILSGKVEVEQKFAAELENIFRAHGYGSEFEKWNCRDRWAINFKKEI